MFNKLKTKLIVKRFLKKTPRKKFILPPEKINSILVLTDNNIPLIESQLKSFFPKSNFYYLSTRKQKNDNSPNNHFLFHASDLGLGSLKNKKLNQLLTLDFEVLIDYNRKKSNMDFFIQIINSNLISGYYNSEKNYLYDILLEGDNMIENLHKQLNKLTKNE
ncbi:MAG TPA: hypothetical protein EYG85_00530 [Crocinitomix sp.]|nr:hypothetical protein [Crocinitomix sp.]